METNPKTALTLFAILTHMWVRIIDKEVNAEEYYDTMVAEGFEEEDGKFIISFEVQEDSEGQHFNEASGVSFYVSHIDDAVSAFNELYLAGEFDVEEAETEEKTETPTVNGPVDLD